MQQPDRVVLVAEVAAEIQQGDPVFSLANHIESKEPGGQRQLGRLHDCSGCEGGLMTTVAALITLELPAVDEATIMAIATWETEPSRPASLHQSSLTLLIAVEDPLELKQGKAILGLDGTA